MAHPFWPLFDLEVRTPRLTLRYVDDELGVEVAHLALRGIHDKDFMPFATPWTDVPDEELGPNSFRHWWLSRAETTIDRWNINLAVIEHGDTVREVHHEMHVVFDQEKRHTRRLPNFLQPERQFLHLFRVESRCGFVE